MNWGSFGWNVLAPDENESLKGKFSKTADEDVTFQFIDCFYKQ